MDKFKYSSTIEICKRIDEDNVVILALIWCVFTENTISIDDFIYNINCSISHRKNNADYINRDDRDKFIAISSLTSNIVCNYSMTPTLTSGVIFPEDSSSASDLKYMKDTDGRVQIDIDTQEIEVIKQIPEELIYPLRGNLIFDVDNNFLI